MKLFLRLLLSAMLLLPMTESLQAQLSWGAPAQDWTLTDLDGTTWNLYDLLDDGKVVYIDFSATWCSYCWNYHNNHALENFYQQYGPDGTDEVMVFFIELDPGTSDACLYGNCGNTYGDWTIGTSYPIINATPAQCTQLDNNYLVPGFPTIYMISTSMQAYEVGSISTNGLASYIPSGQMSADITTSIDPCGAYADIDLSVTGGAGSLSYDWSTGQSTEDLSSLSPGLYSVTITDNNGVFVEEQVSLSFEPEIEIFYGDIIQPSCSGSSNGSILVTANDDGTYTYDWSDGSTGSEIFNLGAGTYNVLITDGSGCTLEEDYIVEDPDEIIISFLEATPESCGNADGTVTINATGGTGTLTYDIGFGPTDIDYFNALAAGDYTVTIEDDNGCSVQQAFTIESSGTAALSVSGAEEELGCTVSEVILTGNGDNSDYDYGWKDSDGNVLTTEATLSITSPGMYTFYGTLGDCYVEEAVEVTESNVVPQAEILSSITLTCSLTSMPINATTSFVPTGASLSWTTTDGNIVSGESTLYPVVDQAGTYTLSIVYGDCTSTADITIDENTENPEAVITSDGLITCASQEVTLSSAGSSSGADISYQWQDDQGNDISSASTATVMSAGAYSLIVTDGINGCSTTTTFMVDVDMNAPEANAGVDETLTCEQSSIMLLGSSSTEGDLTYMWTTDDGSINSEANAATIEVSVAGTYTLEITDTNNGCTATDQVVVTEDYDAAEAAYSFSSNYLEVAFTNASSGSSLSYLWSFGDGSSSTEMNPTHVYSMASAYEVCLTANNGCGDNTTCETINVEQASISVTSSITHVVCAGESNGSIALNIEGTDAVQSYDWSNGDTTKDISGLVAGTYSVVIETASGQSYTYMYTVNEPDAIIVSSQVIDVVCNGESSGEIAVDASGGTGTLTFAWSNGETSSTIQELPAGTYTVTITDENNCTLEQDFDIEENTTLASSVVAIDNEEGTIDIDVSGGVPPYTYEWNDGSSDEDLSKVSSGIYSVVITDAVGCVTTIEDIQVMLVGVEEITGLNEFSVFPNPFVEEINVTLNFDTRLKGELLLMNATGKVVFERDVEGREILETIELSSLPVGYYIMSVVTEYGTAYKKIIKY